MLDQDFYDYMANNFGQKNSAKDDWFGWTGGNSYNGKTYGNAYAGGTNGSSYAGWVSSNPLSGINAFSGNTGSMGYGPDPTSNYDPRMGMKDNASHLGASSPMGGGSGGGSSLKGQVSYDDYRPYGTGKAWSDAGGAQKYGGGIYDDLIAANQTQGSGTIMGDRGIDYHRAFTPDLPSNNDPHMGDTTRSSGYRQQQSQQQDSGGGGNSPTLPPFSGGGKNFSDYSKMGGSSNDLNNNWGRQAETYYDPSSYVPESGNPLNHSPYQQVDNGNLGRWTSSYQPGEYYPSSILDGQIGSYFDQLPAWNSPNYDNIFDGGGGDY